MKKELKWPFPPGTRVMDAVYGDFGVVIKHWLPSDSLQVLRDDGEMAEFWEYRTRVVSPEKLATAMNSILYNFIIEVMNNGHRYSYETRRLLFNVPTTALSQTSDYWLVLWDKLLEASPDFVKWIAHREPRLTAATG